MNEDLNQIEQLKLEIYNLKQEVEEIKKSLLERKLQSKNKSAGEARDASYAKHFADHLLKNFSKNINIPFYDIDWD